MNVTLEHSILYGNSDTQAGGNSGDQFYAFPTAGSKPVAKWTPCNGDEGQSGDPGAQSQWWQRLLPRQRIAAPWILAGIGEARYTGR